MELRKEMANLYRQNKNYTNDKTITYRKKISLTYYCRFLFKKKNF